MNKSAEQDTGFRRGLASDPLVELDLTLKTVFGGHQAATRPSPANDHAEPALEEQERQLSRRLMRVNHSGEVCAQALYQGHRLAARSSRVSALMAQAAAEEIDHLAWTERRIRELGGSPSVLNGLFYAGSLGLGMIAGALGDRINLGFVEATEQNVVRHLDEHLARLPAKDDKSAAVLEQMRQDEARHADAAGEAGAVRFPAAVQTLMNFASRLMTRTTYWL